MFGPPIPGAPWVPPLVGREGVAAGIAGPKPAPAPGPAPSQVAKQPYVERDPDLPPRSRRNMEKVSEIFNSLIRTGDLVHTAPGDWRLNTPAAGGGGTLTTLDVTTPTTLTGILRGTGTLLSTVTIGAGLSFVGGTLSAVGGGGSDPISSVYPVFGVTGIDDEFDGGSFSGWTAVHAGFLTTTQTNNRLSVVHNGGAAAAELSAYVKADTFANGDYIETAFMGMGPDQAVNIMGLVFADGDTYNAGNQVVFYWSPREPFWYIVSYTGYNTAGAFVNETGEYQAPHGDMFLRFVMSAANTWDGYVSPDGVGWVHILQLSRTLTPTRAGVFFTSWTGVKPFAWSLRYFKRN